MKPRSPVLQKLAEAYAESAAGRHGEGKIDFQPDYEEVLRDAGCAEGEARELAERALRAAHQAGVLTLVPIHPRDPQHVTKVRLAPDGEAAFFAYVGLPSPTARRAEWVALFEEAAEWPVPIDSLAWKAFCAARAAAAVNWRGMRPFDRDDLPAGRALLSLLPRLLAWEGRHLVRWASSLLCGDSKLLERRQRTLEALLAEATAGTFPSYLSLGILPVPPDVTFHGPLRLRIGEEWHDYGGHAGEVTLSGADVERITACECTGQRCVTVENATPFRSLVSLRSGELLLQTSYPNEATLGLLARLKIGAPQLAYWHFGDTDPSGFHILADLRDRSGLPFQAFQMEFRSSENSPLLSVRERALIETLLTRMPKERAALEAMLASGRRGDFEQESLRPPTLATWPFYG